MVFVYTADLARSDQFYGQILGLELVLDQGACHIYRVSSTGYVGLCDHKRPSPGGATITIVSPAVDVWHERLVTAGVDTQGPPSYNEKFGVYQFFAADPDGNVLEFQSFGPEWPGPLAG